MSNAIQQLSELLNQRAVFIACLFGAVALFAWAIFGLFIGTDSARVKRRLRGHERERTPVTTNFVAKRAMPPLVEKLAEAASRPLMPKQLEEQSRLRKRLGFAGLYSSTTMQLFVGSKIILMAIGALCGFLLGSRFGSSMLAIWLACTVGLIGLVLPNYILSLRIRQRQQTLQASLPDALDLMVVCVEAGLTIDAAIQRVGNEIALAHPEISKELGITHMETRIGLSRIDALRNLGHRTGSASLQSLAAMLVQAERFGTSIGAALRVHADSLRVKRQNDAEERAAKTTVKLAFPVVFFIFIPVVAVLGAPAFILILKSPMFAQP